MATVRKAAIVNGTPYLSDVGVNAGESMGNASKFSVTANTEKVVLPNYQGGGGNDTVFYKFKDGNIVIEARHVSLETLALALGGTAEAVAAGAVADEAHTVVALEKLIALDHMQDMSATLTVTPALGGDPFVEGVDYTRKRLGIIPLTGGDIAAAAVLKFAYTKHKHQRFQALLNTITEKRVLFDGINELTNKPWAYIFHRVGFGPAKNLELIGDNFASFTLEGEILAYEGITEAGKSQFYEALVGDL